MANTSDRLRWGLVSTARINRSLIGPLRDSPRSELVAVASRSADRAKAYAEERTIPKSYGSYEAMYNDPAIDAVYISLPNSLHAEWAIKAAQAGKHVLCEKPIVPTLAELDQVEAAANENGVTIFEAFMYVEAAANENGVTIFEAFMYLHHPQLLRAQEMIREGRLGQVQLIDSWFSFYLPPSGTSASTPPAWPSP